MARFDIHRSRDGGTLLINCQAELLDDLQTCFVVPLMTPDEGPKCIARLNPQFDIEGEKLIMYTQFAGSIRKSDLGPATGSLADHDMTILAAIDMLISGY